MNYANKGMVVEGDAATQYSPKMVRTSGREVARAADATSMAATGNDDVQTVHAKVQALKKANACKMFDEDPVCRRVRLTALLPHHAIDTKQKFRRCQICSTRTSVGCSSCGVSLCNKPNAPNAPICIHIWHDPNVTLVTKRNLMNKRKDKVGDGETQDEEEKQEGEQKEDTDSYTTPAASRRGRRRSRSSGGNSRGSSGASSGGASTSGGSRSNVSRRIRQRPSST